MNSIIIRRTASTYDCEIVMSGQRTVVDLSKMKSDDRATLVHRLKSWKANDYKGYPQIS